MYSTLSGIELQHVMRYDMANAISTIFLVTGMMLPIGLCILRYLGQRPVYNMWTAFSIGIVFMIIGIIGMISFNYQIEMVKIEMAKSLQSSGKINALTKEDSNEVRKFLIGK